MERYRLPELAAVSGVAPRTIRYYIAEGLLPPPEGTGPAAAYTAAHRDRLALIVRLKGRYLPLRAITERLRALSDEAVRAELADPGPSPAPPDLAAQGSALAAPAVDEPLAAAREVWTRVTVADGIELHVRADRLRQPVSIAALVRRARDFLGEE